MLVPVWTSAQTLTLACEGKGTVMGTQSIVLNQYDFRLKQNKTRVVQTQVHRPFSGTGMVEVAPEAARMRIPDPMIPLLSGGGNEGWYPIDSLLVADREITGVVHINALNQPKLHIDRMTGKLSLQGGMSDFSAECRSAADANKPKF
jgi:hypothetical protein